MTTNTWFIIEKSHYLLKIINIRNSRLKNRRPQFPNQRSNGEKLRLAPGSGPSLSHGEKRVGKGRNGGWGERNGGREIAGRNRTRKRHFANMTSHLAMRRVRTWRGRGWNITVLSIELRFSIYGDRDRHTTSF